MDVRPITDALHDELAEAQTDVQLSESHVTSARMFVDLGMNDAARSSATLAQSRLQDAARRVAAVLAALAIAVGIVTVQPAGHAAAVVLPVVQPVKVTLAGPVTTLRTTVVSTAPTTYQGGHMVYVSAPLATGQVRVGSGVSSTPLVTVKATLPSRLFRVGRSVWMTRDVGDNRLAPLTVDARQASRFAQAQIAAAMPCYVFVVARLTHYKATTGTYVPSQASPVQLQAWSGTVWNTLATFTTDTQGAVYQTAMAVPGDATYRLVRPDGATVWGTSSAPVLVNASPTYDY